MKTYRSLHLYRQFVMTCKFGTMLMRVTVGNSAWKISLGHQSLSSFFHSSFPHITTSVLPRNFIITQRHEHEETESKMELLLHIYNIFGKNIETEKSIGTKFSYTNDFRRTKGPSGVLNTNVFQINDCVTPLCIRVFYYLRVRTLHGN